MEWPDIPFGNEFIGKPFPKGAFKVFDKNKKEIALGIFQRNVFDLELKTYGIVVTSSEEKEIHFFATNPLAFLEFKGDVQQISNFHMSNKYNGFYDIQSLILSRYDFPIFRSFCSSNDVLEDGKYLYFEILNFNNKMSPINENYPTDVLSIPLHNETLFIKPLPKEKWVQISYNCYVDSIGAIEIVDEDPNYITEKLDKIMKILSIYFMNYISAGSLKWWKKIEKDWFEFNGIRSYESTTPRVNHVCLTYDRKGELHLVKPGKIDSLKKRLLEKFLKVLSYLKMADLDFFREFIAGGRNERYVENQIVKLMSVAEKIHAMLGIEMNLMEPNQSVCKKVLNKIYQRKELKPFHSLQKEAYIERGNILHSRFLDTSEEAIEKRLDIANKIPLLTSILLHTLLSEIERKVSNIG